MNPKFARETLFVRQIPCRGSRAPGGWRGHPFVGAGLGHLLPAVPRHGNRSGERAKLADAVRGVEFFTSNSCLEGRSAIPHGSKVNDFNPSGLAFTIGVTSYFDGRSAPGRSGIDCRPQGRA